MINRMLFLFCLLVGVVGAQAAEHTVGQLNKQFTTEEITIKKGDVVQFRNQDPFFHNVFSLSDSKFFDLGSYPEGESRGVTFEDAGEIEVECAIHPSMKLKIHVAD